MHEGANEIHLDLLGIHVQSQPSGEELGYLISCVRERLRALIDGMVMVHVYREIVAKVVVHGIFELRPIELLGVGINTTPRELGYLLAGGYEVLRESLILIEAVVC